jgi:hypothetical protein
VRNVTGYTLRYIRGTLHPQTVALEAPAGTG